MRFIRTNALPVLAAAAACLVPAAAARGRPIFQGLGFPAGKTASSASAVSADGSTVVGNVYNSAEGYQAGFAWTATGGMRLLPSQSGSSSNAVAVSANGSVIVGDSGGWPARWTLSGLRSPGVDLGDGFMPVGGNATGVSRDGSVVVGVAYVWPTPTDSGDIFFCPVRWTAGGGMQQLAFLQQVYPEANISPAVSGDGSVVVVRQWGYEAARWTQQEGMVLLGVLPGRSYSDAHAVSDDGSAIVGQSGEQAFRWTATGGMQGLGLLPGYLYSSADAVSADGSTIVGTAWDDYSDLRPFLWDAIHGIRDLREVLMNDYGLNLDGWALTSAVGISAGGSVVVGNGIDPSGNSEAWIAVVPEPTGIALLIIQAGGLVARRWRNPKRCAESLM